MKRNSVAADAEVEAVIVEVGLVVEVADGIVGNVTAPDSSCGIMEAPRCWELLEISSVEDEW